MKKNITLLRRILLNQVYMMRHMNKVVQREDEPIANSESLYLQTFESASATAQELKEVATVDRKQRRTPTDIKFTQQLPGIHSFGIRNGDQSLLIDFPQGGRRVYTAKHSGLCECPLTMINIEDLSLGDVIYTSNDPKEDFSNPRLYYLFLGKEFAAWDTNGGVNVWASPLTYLWRVEIA